ncbi:type I 3-dehydroquinate dehydratase [bacterium]|nr:type I 3-dehydroquinate dehydratase [bacterium]
MKCCLPIRTAEFENVRATVERYDKDFDLFEIWLDYLEGDSQAEVVSFIEESATSFLLLFRREDLSPSRTPFKERKRYIESLQRDRIVWDFDITVQEEELDFYRAESRSAGLIVSYHNYTRTPSDRDLRETVARMEQYAPDTVKLACLCENQRDALRLLLLAEELRSAGKSAVVLGMGEYGMMTRIFAEQLGSAYTFLTVLSSESEAPVATASGQLALEEKKQIDAILERMRKR